MAFYSGRGWAVTAFAVIGAGACTTVTAGSTSIPADRVTIVVQAVEPKDFLYGPARSCGISVKIYNTSKFRLNGATFEAEGQGGAFDVPKVVARSEVNIVIPVNIERLSLSNCAMYAKYLIETARFTVRECSMPSVAEGDCQDLVTIRSEITSASVKK